MIGIDTTHTLNSLNKAPKIDEKSTDLAKLKEQTDAFEALILKQMLDISLKMDNALLPEEPGSKIYKSMFKETLSQELAGSFGYSELLFNYLKDRNNL